MKFTNRKIKFRVWTGAKMEYKVLAGSLGHFYVEGMSNKDSACLSEANTIYNEAAPLMQWTGLVDKNGVEIWEGDILDVEYVLMFQGVIRSINIVEPFCRQSSMSDTFGGFSGIPRMANKKNSGSDCPWIGYNKMQVIGNIFQNPELLKS